MRWIQAIVFTIALTGCGPNENTIKETFVPENASDQWLETWNKNLEYLFPGFVLQDAVLGDMICVMFDSENMVLECALMSQSIRIRCQLMPDDIQCSGWSIDDPKDSDGMSM